MFAASGRPKRTKETVLRILSYMGEFKGRLLLVGLLLVVSTLTTLVRTYSLKPLINNHIVPFIGSRDPDLSGLTRILLGLSVVYLIDVAAIYATNRIMLQVSNQTLHRIRCELFEKMERLPIRYFDTHSHGELMSLYSNDINTLRNLLSQGLIGFFSSGMVIVGVFFAMLSLNPLLTVLMLAMVLLMSKSVTWLSGHGRAGYRAQQKALGQVNGYIEELLEGQKVVKVFCYEQRAKEQFDQLNEQLRQAAVKANTFSGMLMPVTGSLSYINYAIIAIASSVMAIFGMVDLGTVAAFLQYSRAFSQPITQIAMQFATVLSALAGAERIFAAMDEPPEQDEGEVSLVTVRRGEGGRLQQTDRRTGLWAWRIPGAEGGEELREVRGDVVFKDVVFGYVPDKVVLNGISLYAKPGQKIALVGATGAGKTTITNLLNRFYDLPDGRILYDGIDINRIRKPDLRRSLSMVLQDTRLFTGSVMDNIRYGRLDASDQEVVEAAGLANADGFVQYLPEGYDTLLTADGGNLSQGQRQLLAIARAAVADPPVLVLDEATSSIDTRTEALIERGMDSLMAGRTTFVIAHRLSTVRNANAIIVLEQGEIIERGDHDELIAARGKYYQLYTGMFELE
ncbi:MAG: ABC transporter ATP-binding protein [Clostridiales bacterium]|nr:ABC transporter ATP-binding protein [Clostridiales bacterium]